MSMLLVNSYGMWLARLAVVLVAVGGGLAWWTLSGDDNFIDADVTAQACQQLPPITDYDIRAYIEVMEDGVKVVSGDMYIRVSGDDHYMFVEAQQGHEKWERLTVDETLYERRSNGPWTKLLENAGKGLTYPARPEDICPDNLGAFTYADTDTVDGQATKRFTVQNLYNPGTVDTALPKQGENEKERDWQLWIDDKGYLVKASFLSVSAKVEGTPYETMKITNFYSGFNEPNVLPDPEEA